MFETHPLDGFNGPAVDCPHGWLCRDQEDCAGCCIKSRVAAGGEPPPAVAPTSEPPVGWAEKLLKFLQSEYRDAEAAALHGSPWSREARPHIEALSLFVAAPYLAPAPPQGDLVARLREPHIAAGAPNGGESIRVLLRSAADEIERLLTLTQGWQDIATAPRDGTHVLVINVASEVGVLIAAWQPGDADDGEPRIKRWCVAWDGQVIHMQPTHWMLLPAPPLAAANTGGE